jgi:hypothetical protein
MENLGLRIELEILLAFFVEIREDRIESGRDIGWRDFLVL